MKDKPIRSILDQSFNYALQDIVELVELVGGRVNIKYVEAIK